MRIYIRTPEQKAISLEVKGSDKISQVKALLNLQDNTIQKTQECFFNGERLDNDKTLDDYHILENCALTFIPEYSLYVKGIGGDDTVITLLDFNITVKELKEKVAKLIQRNVQEINLFHEAQAIKDEETLSSIKIGHLETIHYVIRLHGGYTFQ